MTATRFYWASTRSEASRLKDGMNLSPTEIERLVVFNAAEFARRNIRRGIPLSHPEAVAYLTDEAMLMARSDVPYKDIRQRVGQLLTPEHVESGVPDMIPLIMLELNTAAGTKLITIYDPIPSRDGDMIPGEIFPVAEPKMVFDDQATVYVDVVNTGDRDVQVRSMTHFFEVNRALSFDRRAAYGMKLAIPAGDGVRFEPGVPKRAALTPLSGNRVVLGQAGLVNGPLDQEETRRAAFASAAARGYLEAQE